MTRNILFAATAAAALMTAPVVYADAHAMSFDAEKALSLSADQASALSAVSGSKVTLMDGTLFGTVTEASMENDGQVDLFIDLDGGAVAMDKPRAQLSISPEKVSITDDAVALNVSEQEILTAAPTDGGSDDIAKFSIQ